MILASCLFRLATAALGSLKKLCLVEMSIPASLVRASKSSKVCKQKMNKNWLKFETSLISASIKIDKKDKQCRTNFHKNPPLCHYRIDTEPL